MSKTYELYRLSSDTKVHRQFVDTDKHSLVLNYDLYTFEDVAIMHLCDYEAIFGHSRNMGNIREKRLSVVKITYRDELSKQKSIYRQYRPSYLPELQGKVAVTVHSVLFLKEGEKPILGRTVVVSRGNRLQFYLNHPNPIVRTSFILGAISVALGIISIIIVIITLI